MFGSEDFDQKQDSGLDWDIGAQLTTYLRAFHISCFKSTVKLIPKLASKESLSGLLDGQNHLLIDFVKKLIS